MSEYASFQIDGYELLSAANYADPETLSLFQEADKHLRVRGVVAGRRWTSSWLSPEAADGALSEAHDGRTHVRLPPGAAWEEADPEDGPDDDTGETALGCGGGDPVVTPGLTAPGSEQVAELDLAHSVAGHGYISMVARVRDRLDAKGFTLAAAGQVLAEHVQARLASLTSREQHPDLSRLHEEEREVLASLTLSAWTEAFRWVVARDAHKIDEWGRYANDPVLGSYYIPAAEAPALVRHLLAEHRDHYYGFPQGNVRYLYRAALDAFAPEAPVVLDLSHVSLGWTYDADDAVVEDARQARLADYPADAPIIVLTEGVTDQRALQAALRLLYPHLADLYTFLDLDAMRVRGGAPALVGMVKAFAAAGVANRVVALFDNDTAAHNALRDLRSLALPEHIRVLTYPPLPFAAAYPSIGPHGAQPSDVNGSAGSLELYFGEDVLRSADGALTPVQWGSYEPALQRYHGELRDKARLQERFSAKVAAADADRHLTQKQDWSGMRAILDAVRRAFD